MALEEPAAERAFCCAALLFLGRLNGVGRRVFPMGTGAPAVAGSLCVIIQVNKIPNTAPEAANPACFLKRDGFGLIKSLLLGRVSRLALSGLACVFFNAS